jgi:cytochrome c peroxidase
MAATWFTVPEAFWYKRRAMVSGDIGDVGKFRPPILRGLAARSPYFHAGTAQNIQMLIHFYNARFQIFD